MTATAKELPSILNDPSTRRIPVEPENRTLTELRKAARTWVGAEQSKLSKDPLVAALRRALEDDKTAGRVLNGLSKDDRAVVAAYRRYGGVVDGEVIRLELRARGLLEIIETRVTETYTSRRWKRDPIATLAERWILLSDQPPNAYDPYRYGYGTDKRFGNYSLHAGIARLVEPAGPPPWSVPHVEEPPQTPFRRSPAEVALDLSRICAAVAARGSIKLRKDGTPAGPALRALEKAVPLDEGSDYPLPEPHALYLDLLRYAGVLRVEENTLQIHPAEATRQLTRPDPWQAYTWAQGWLNARHWIDGSGTPDTYDWEDSTRRIRSSRQILAWALASLAHAGDHWYELETFLSELQKLQGHSGHYLGFGIPVWNPDLERARAGSSRGGDEVLLAGWFRREGTWYANAILVTLVALGLIERGRLGRGKNAPHAFRLTEPGRAVFGAPEIPPPDAPSEPRFLLVQPNFDILAYLDQTDAASAGMLGRLAEGDAAGSGPIQTFRLTQASVYQAQESGLDIGQIDAFLRRCSRHEPPVNVLRTIADWAGKRESLTLRSGVTVLAFPATPARDAYLKRHPDATACGDRFALVSPGTEKGRPRRTGAAIADHRATGRRTLEVDEHGRIHSTGPLDIVQTARLRRLARSISTGWHLTADSIRAAADSGLKPRQIHLWLTDHLAKPMPPLLAHAIDAWLGKAPPLALADALLLHVSDDNLFWAIRSSHRLRSYVLGSPGPRWLAIRRESRKELTAALEELGFSVGRELTWSGATTADPEP